MLTSQLPFTPFQDLALILTTDFLALIHWHAVSCQRCVWIWII